MSLYILRRLLIAVPVIWGITLISYFIINLAPGDPVDLLISPFATPEEIQAKRVELGLHEPIPVRYVKWLNEVRKGNLGYSVQGTRTVADRISERIAPTILLTGSALLFSYLVAVPLGVISAVKRYSVIDIIVTVLGFAGVSIPSFFFGMSLIFLFALQYPILPTGGVATIGQEFSVWDRAWHLILPAMVLGLNQVGSLLRYTRSGMLEVIGQDFIRTARAKGLSERIVLYKHALRNALIPLVTLLGLSVPHLLGGAIVVEQIFQWPGLGRLALEAIQQRDYPVLMGLNLMTASLVVAGSLLADILYGVIDPRIRLR